MKSILWILTALLPALCCEAQIASSDFVTVWKTDNAGISANNQIVIPATGQYTVYYESIPSALTGSFPTTGVFTDAQTITLPTPGTYRIAIKPAGTTPLLRINFSSGSDAQKLLEIQQWGTTTWSTMEGAYRNCANLAAVSAADVPDLSNVTSMRLSFAFCLTLASAPAINNWNVGTVTDMRNVFARAELFNEPLDKWNVSNVTNMSSMFERADSFNRPLNSWNVTNVANTSSMFLNAETFNQPLDKWNVSNVTNMRSMFEDAASFNQSFASWVLNADASGINMLRNSGLDCENLSKTLVGWADNPGTPDNISLGTNGLSGLTYGAEAQAAFNHLVSTKGWFITGATVDPNCTFSLPVHLVSFAASVSAGEPGVRLDWVTSWEQDNKGFEIERSSNARQWTKIGNVNTLTENGSSGSSLRYSFTDTNPTKGTNYYRLRQVDYNGQSQYSRIRSVSFGQEAVLTAFPNPTSDKITLKNLNKAGEIRVYNVTGQLLQMRSISGTTEQISLQPHPTGIYQIVIIPKREAARTVKVVKRDNQQ